MLIIVNEIHVALDNSRSRLAFRGWRVGLCHDGLSIPPCFLCSSKRENDSPSPIIGDRFLGPYNVDYVGQSPPFLSSSAVMEQIPGASLFLRRFHET